MIHKHRIIFFVFIFMLSGCKKLDEYTMFNMPYSENITIPFSPETETNSESTFEINNTRKDLIEEIKLKKLELNIQSPENEDYSFLESISVFLSADDLPEIKVAYNENVSETTTNTLKLNILDTD
ncbi:MAG: hypothetical protein AB8B74_06075 [Crocinitomicaceae bacterium]